MNRSIEIILRAKNAMAAGLSKARESLAAFGSSAMRIGGFFVKSFLAAGTAIAGFAAKAIAAYAGQETAERALVGAINAHGQAGEALLPMMRKIASAIQDETGAADESTLAGMAKMRMLGVQTSRLGEAAKAVVALKSLGLEEAAAHKAVAMAMQGNYDMLNRYVPALRTATSESEKAQIVNDLFARGYEQQAGLLNTVGGQWNLLKGRIGDVWEEIGRAIMQNEGLMASLKRAGEAVKEFGEKIGAWVKGGGIIRLTAGVKYFYEDVRKTFRLIGNTFAVTWAALGDGADTAISYVSNVISAWVNAVVAQFKYVGDYAVALWNKVKKPFSKFDPPDMGPYLKSLKDLGKAIAGESGIVTKRTEKALADREKIHEEFAKRNEEIANETAKKLIAHEDKITAAKKAAAEAEKKLAEETTKVVARETEKQKKAALKALKEKLAEIQKEKAKIEDLAKARVQAVIDQHRAEKEEAESRAKDEAKALRLAEQERRGVRLGRKDKEFLEAAREIEAAKTKVARLGKAEALVAGKIGAAEAALKVQEDIRDDLDVIKNKIEQSLEY